MSNFDNLINVKQTEKSNSQISLNKYSFLFSKSFNKIRILNLISKTFKVEVVGVNIINYKPKERKFKGVVGQEKGYKKAIVTLKEGNSINFS